MTKCYCSYLQTLLFQSIFQDVNHSAELTNPLHNKSEETKAQAIRLMYRIVWFNFFYHATAERSYHHAISVSWITGITIEHMHVPINRVSLWDKYTFLFQILTSMFWQRPKTKGVQVQCLDVKFPFSMEWG